MAVKMENPSVDVREVSHRMQELTRDQKYYLINVGDEPWIMSRTYGVYQIAPRGKARYSVTEVRGTVDRIDRGDGQVSIEPVFALDIAKDLVREQDLSRFGVFVSATTTPSEDELLSAEVAVLDYYNQVVAAADTDWSRRKIIGEIPDIAKRAVRRLGIEREYCYVPQDFSDCPACGEKVKKGVAVCKHCHAILDSKKAAQFFPQEKAHGKTDRSNAEANS